MECDVLVAGSGAGGMAAAVAARLHGLEVVVAEKEPLFGGTTAVSGGGLWLPNSTPARALGAEDSPEAVRTYLEHEVGNRLDGALADAFIAAAPRMVDFFQERTAVKFLAAAAFPDYHPTSPGSRPGRTLRAAPFDARALGERLSLLRPPLRQMTVLGMLAVSGEEVLHFMRATRSATSALYVSRVVARHFLDLARHGRGTRLTNGNALAARLLRAALDAGVTLWNASPVEELLTEGGRVTGAVVRRPEGPVRVACRRGVVLACGGFPANDEMRTRIFPHPSARVRHWWPGPKGNTGDGIRLGTSVGGTVRNDHSNVAAWTPFSLVPGEKGEVAPFPHFVDRGKPGVIAVGPDGRRFVNESNSYHDLVEAMLARYGGDRGEDVHAFMVADRRAIRRYGLGFAKPFPFPLRPYLRSGYLMTGATPRELAGRLGVDPDAFEETIRRYNGPARAGEDPEFGRGGNVYNRYMGDPFHEPNPCVAPLDTAPYYAVRIVPGELATFPGLAVDPLARVVDGERRPVPGLYAAGNDMASIMGGGYPGPGITLGPAMTFGYIAARHLAGFEEP